MRQTKVKLMETSDNALALAAADGDAAAFATLLERQYDRLFRLCFRLTGSQAEAEDLTQDICAALPAKLRAYRGEAAFTTWLYRVAVNATHDRRRRSASHAKAAQGWGDWEVNRVATNAETAERLDWLTNAMRALPDDIRDTLALVLDGQTHEAVGTVLSIPAGTVAWRVSEAKKRLAQIQKEEAS
jgi:RNA polymerase sigma-70 factor (ECF subfamily)